MGFCSFCGSHAAYNEDVIVLFDTMLSKYDTWDLFAACDDCFHRLKMFDAGDDDAFNGVHFCQPIIDTEKELFKLRGD